MEERVKDILGAEAKDQFLSTASREDSASQVYLSTYIDFMRQTGRNHFLIREPQFMLKRLEILGCALKILPVNERGQVTPAILEEMIKPRAALVSLPWADARTGVIHPIAALAELCREKEVRFHVDASEVIGKLFFRFQDLPVDFLSFDGGLLIKADTEFVGQAHPHAQLVDALERDLSRFDHFCTETVRLRDRLERGIKEGYPEAKVLFEDAERLPHISAIEFPGAGNEPLLYHLHRQGFEFNEAGPDAVSFRLTEETTQEEIDRLIDAAVSAAKQLRELSDDLETV
jgi:cysteine desulfurase